ncbi:small integral membrane protein 1 [Salvelinus alpinus]
MASDMDSNTAGVQYNRWNEDNINLNVAGTGVTGPLEFTDCVWTDPNCNQWSYYDMTCSVPQRLYNRVCTGTLGIAIKVAGALAALVTVYIIGYVTGYYVHKC